MAYVTLLSGRLRKRGRQLFTSVLEMVLMMQMRVFDLAMMTSCPAHRYHDLPEVNMHQEV